jgi:hypothetical protein
VLYPLDACWPDAHALPSFDQASHGSSANGSSHGSANGSLSPPLPGSPPLPSSSPSPPPLVFPALPLLKASLQRVPWCAAALADVGPPDEAQGLLDTFPDPPAPAAGEGGGDAAPARPSAPAVALQLAAAGRQGGSQGGGQSGVVYGTQSLYLMLRSHQARPRVAWLGERRRRARTQRRLISCAAPALCTHTHAGRHALNPDVLFCCLLPLLTCA